MKRKKVILTIDVEGPRGSDPVLYQIWGKVGENYFGIPKIIEICNKYNVKGLFFVDIPEIWDYGYDKIKNVILYIRKSGHDVGIHIHPHHMPGESRHFLFDYTKQEQKYIIEQCTNKYFEITGEMPLSFRAGKYGANKDTLDILSELGYKYDFSEFYSQKWCGINPPIGYVLPRKYKGITEIPVTVFKSFKLFKYKRYDKLEVTDNPNEIKHVLRLYSKTKNNEIIVLFLHSFSFLDYLDKPDNPSLNKSNVNNFESVMTYLSESDKFDFISESDLNSIEAPSLDKVDNIVETKGFLRRLFYFYKRAFQIRKTNSKAKSLLILTGVAGVMLLGTIIGLIIGLIL